MPPWSQASSSMARLPQAEESSSSDTAAPNGSACCWGKAARHSRTPLSLITTFPWKYFVKYLTFDLPALTVRLETFFPLQSDSGKYSILLKKIAHFISFTHYDSLSPLLSVYSDGTPKYAMQSETYLSWKHMASHLCPLLIFLRDCICLVFFFPEKLSPCFKWQISVHWDIYAKMNEEEMNSTKTNATCKWNLCFSHIVT